MSLLDVRKRVVSGPASKPAARHQKPAKLELTLPSDQLKRLSAYAKKRGTTVERLLADHVSFLVAQEDVLVVDAGRGMDPELREWAVSFAAMHSTTVPQLLLDYLVGLRSVHSHVVESI